MRLAVLALCTALVAVGAPGGVAYAAEAAEQAAPLAEEGLDHFDAGRYEQAISAFEKAERVYHAPTHVYYIARAHERLGRLVAAQHAYRRVAEEPVGDDAPKIFHKVRTDARTALAALKARIPTLTIVVEGADPADVRLSLDGEALPGWRDRAIMLDPGTHSIAVKGQSIEPQTLAVDVREHQRESITIDVVSTAPDPDPVEPDTGSATPGAVILALGIAGLSAGAISGAFALDKAAQLEDVCPTRQCRPEDRDLGNTVETLGNVSTGAFIAGGLVAATGIALLIWKPDDASTDNAVHIRPAVGGIVVEGRF